MSFLSQVTTGKVKTPHRIVLYGPDGVGKTTFASNAPNPIFSGIEKGTAHIDTTRFPQPGSFKDAQDQVKELISSKHT